MDVRDHDFRDIHLGGLEPSENNHSGIAWSPSISVVTRVINAVSNFFVKMYHFCADLCKNGLSLLQAKISLISIGGLFNFNIDKFFNFDQSTESHHSADTYHDHRSFTDHLDCSVHVTVMNVYVNNQVNQIIYDPEEDADPSAVQYKAEFISHLSQSHLPQPIQCGHSTADLCSFHAIQNLSPSIACC